jgi:hypothetical protein
MVSTNSENELKTISVDDKNTFIAGEVIWAKIKGYPWWPAVIFDFRESDTTVSFIGEKSHAYLQMNQIKKFSENYIQFSNPRKRNKKLDLSVQIANNIRNGKIKFEDHEKYLDQLRISGISKEKEALSNHLNSIASSVQKKVKDELNEEDNYRTESENREEENSVVEENQIKKPEEEKIEKEKETNIISIPEVPDKIEIKKKKMLNKKRKRNETKSLTKESLLSDKEEVNLNPHSISNDNIKDSDKTDNEISSEKKEKKSKLNSSNPSIKPNKSVQFSDITYYSSDSDQFYTNIDNLLKQIRPELETISNSFDNIYSTFDSINATISSIDKKSTHMNFDIIKNLIECYKHVYDLSKVNKEKVANLLIPIQKFIEYDTSDLGDTFTNILTHINSLQEEELKKSEKKKQISAYKKIFDFFWNCARDFNIDEGGGMFQGFDFGKVQSEDGFYNWVINGKFLNQFNIQFQQKDSSDENGKEREDTRKMMENVLSRSVKNIYYYFLVGKFYNGTSS